MRTYSVCLFLPLFLLSLCLAGCSASVSASLTPPSALVNPSTSVTPVVSVIPPSRTPLPPTDTSEPTATPTPVATATPTATEIPPTVTATPGPCFDVLFFQEKEEKLGRSFSFSGFHEYIFYEDSSEDREWTMELPASLPNGAFGFDLVIASSGHTVFYPSLLLRQGNQEVVLAATSFDVATNQYELHHFENQPSVNVASGDTLIFRMKISGDVAGLASGGKVNDKPVYSSILVPCP